MFCGKEQRSWLGERKDSWTGMRAQLRLDTIIVVHWSNGGPGCFLDGKLSGGKDRVWYPSDSFSVIIIVLGIQLTPKHLSQGTLGCNYKKLTLTLLHKKRWGEGAGISRKYSAAPYESQKSGSPLFSQPPEDSMASYLAFIVPLTLLLDQNGHQATFTLWSKDLTETANAVVSKT